MTTSRRIEYMCPHCGWCFDVLLAHQNPKGSGLVPDHAYPTTPVGGRLCPGSGQGPRNPESDRRPLWKDLPTDGEQPGQRVGGNASEKKFQVGVYHEFSSSDPWFHDERDAIEAAKRLHENALPFGKETVGVWDERGQVVYLFFDGEMFRKV